MISGSSLVGMPAACSVGKSVRSLPRCVSESTLGDAMYVLIFGNSEIGFIDFQ